jgi:FkbM family methyltransferase
VPGWRFDAFKTSADPAVHVRHGLWCAANAQHCDHPIVVPWHEGTRLVLHLDNDLSHSLFAGGCYEPNEFAVLDRVLKPGMVFLDGGANEGVYTVFASARVGPTGRVIAVEPSLRELERLKANIKINRTADVIIADVALAERLRSVKLTLAEQQHSGQNTSWTFIYEGVNSIEVRCVRAVTIDDLILAHGLSCLRHSQTRPGGCPVSGVYRGPHHA